MSVERIGSRSSRHPSDEGSEIKYLNVPMAESHFDDEVEVVLESQRRRDSSKFFNRVVGYGVSFAAISAVIIVVVLHYHPIHIHHHGDSETCYLSPACTNINHRYDQQGWTNLTGWPTSSCDTLLQDTGPYCCDICIPSPAVGSSSILQPTLSSDTLNYSYLLMDQIWLPQFCNALSEGHDPTVSHLKGSVCTKDIPSTTPRLTIHGLWPNLFNAPTSVCCTNADQSPYNPLIPSLVQQWPIYKELMVDWIDPTTQAVYGGLSCATCYLLNHEWQKHGTCFESFYPTAENEVDLEIAYFTAAVELHRRMRSNSSALEAMVGQVVPVQTIADLYSRKVNIMCDPQSTYSPAARYRSANGLRSEASEDHKVDSSDDNVGVLLEIQTCWNVTTLITKSTIAGLSTSGEYDLVDCPTPMQTVVSASCPLNVFVPDFQS